MRQLLDAPLGSGGLIGDGVGAGLKWMSAVASNPLPVNVHLIVHHKQFSPQFLVLQWDAAAIAPSLLLPTLDVEAHPFDQQL